MARSPSSCPAHHRPACLGVQGSSIARRSVEGRDPAAARRHWCPCPGVDTLSAGVVPYCRQQAAACEPRVVAQRRGQGRPASGIGMLVLSGAASSLFGPATTALPNFWNYPPRVPHGIGARALVALLILHVGGALYHHVVKRDRILARMGIGG